MADFKTAYAITMKNEGGYAKDPRDVGGETYKGIARNYNQNWEGWRVIDHAKKGPRVFPDCLSLPEYAELNNEMVPNFYRERYWDCYLADTIPWQIIANELFDTGVNMGTQRATLFLQRSINILKMRKHVITTDELVVDGKFGPKTHKALTSMNQEYVRVLFNLLNLMQGNHYLAYIEKDFRQAKFLVGWLERVEIQRKA
jgi:lysozyme family protein